MYAELLNTPHLSRLPEDGAQQPLLESFDAASIQSRLALAEGTGHYGAQVFVEATAVAKTVSDGLCFQSNKKWARDFTPEIVQEEQKTNCYGHTIVLSECLENVRIPHHIVYTNGHAFVMVSDFASFAWMIDAGEPTMNGNMMNSLSKTGLNEVPDQLAKYHRGSVKFRTLDYIKEVKSDVAIETVTSNIQWLTIASIMKNYQFKPENAFEEDHRLKLSVYEPGIGRKVIESLQRMNHFAATGRFLDAYAKIQELEGVYPNDDERSRRPEIRDVILGLISQGFIDMAVDITDSVALSFPPEISPDIRLQTWSADQTREIGARTGRVDILRAAIEKYNSVPLSQHRRRIAQKIAKTNRIIDAQT